MPWRGPIQGWLCTKKYLKTGCNVLAIIPCILLCTCRNLLYTCCVLAAYHAICCILYTTVITVGAAADRWILLYTCCMLLYLTVFLLGGSSCMVKITPNAPNLDHAKK